VISITNTTTANWTATAAAHTITVMVIVWCLEGRHRKSVLYVVVYHFIVMVPAIWDGRKIGKFEIVSFFSAE